MVIARPGEDRRARRIGFDVVCNIRIAVRAVRVGPAHCVTWSTIAPGKSAGEVIVSARHVLRLHRPGAVAVVGAFAQVQPAGTPEIVTVTSPTRSAGIGESEVDWRTRRRQRGRRLAVEKLASVKVP